MDFKRLLCRIFKRKKSLGELAENKAADFLKRKAKLKIIARNWRSGHYETDIIAYDKISNCLVFAEVKCRPMHAKVAGFYAATSKHKSECLKKCARAFMAKSHMQNYSRRFDVVEVNHDGEGCIVEINHFENVQM